MRALRAILVIAAIGAASVVTTASAQFHFGLRVGTAVSSLHFNSSVFDASNRAGLMAGAMIEFTAPFTGLGMDLSVNYVRRNARWMEDNEVNSAHRSYIDVPLNLKWKMNIPVINNIARPFLTTGPAFSFLTGARAAGEAWRSRRFDTSWNFGFGLELFKHLQVSANYGLGLTKAMQMIDATSSADVEARNRYWTVSAAYLF